MSVPVRDASTVVLLRDGADGLEVWLQRRASTLVFAADMHAFPGGAVDPGDAAADVGGADLVQQARVWGDDDVVHAQALLAAAVRETEEECGVVLDPGALVPWARWITPEGPPRRFDARFFLARCPDGAEPAPAASEVAHGHWAVVSAAVERHAAGGLPMWPPTISTLVELTPFAAVADALAAAPRTITAVTG